MRFLVTGATGFIGTNLVSYLNKNGHGVSVLSRRPELPMELSALNLKVCIGDVLDEASIVNAMKEVDGVFHLAGYIGYKKNERQIMDQINIMGTKNVISACRKSNVKRLVHFSSVNAIGASFDGSILNEDLKYNLSKFNLGYSESKKKAEELVIQATKEGLDATILNPSTVYGPGDAKKGSRGTQIKVARGKFPFYPSGGVSIAHIQSVVEASLVAFEKGRSGERYILAGENLTLKRVFEIIAQNANVKAPHIPLPDLIIKFLGKTGDLLERMGKKGPINSEAAILSVMFHWFDSSKAQNELGYVPRSANEAIGLSVEWMKNNGFLK